MLEGTAKCLPSDIFSECLREGVVNAEKIALAIGQLQTNHGKPKREAPPPRADPDDDVMAKVREFAEGRLREVLTDTTHHKVRYFSQWLLNNADGYDL